MIPSDSKGIDELLVSTTSYLLLDIAGAALAAAVALLFPDLTGENATGKGETIVSTVTFVGSRICRTSNKNSTEQNNNTHHNKLTMTKNK